MAASSVEAYKLLKNNTPDLILMDIYIDGDQDGVELMMSIKETLDVPFYLFIRSYRPKHHD